MEELKKFLITLSGLIGTIVVVVLAAYVYRFWDYSFSMDSADWGAFGDYIGGILNPIIAMAAFILLALSLILQSVELKKASEAMKDAAETSKQHAMLTRRNLWIESLKAESELIGAEIERIDQLLQRIYTAMQTPNMAYVDPLGIRLTAEKTKEEAQRIFKVMMEKENKQQSIITEMQRLASEDNPMGDNHAK